MGHTNSTANLSLPQFIGTDKPTWLGDVNGAFSAIDAYAGTNDAAVSAAAASAANAVADASAAVNTANNASTTAGNASNTATAANTVAGQALTLANSTDAKVGALVDLNTTDKSSIVNSINEVLGLTTPVVTVATAVAGISYADQLLYLENAFNALGNNEKARCVITTGNKIYHIQQAAAGTFARSFVESTEFGAQSLSLSAHTYYEYRSGGQVYDYSSNSNGSIMDLVLL